MVKSRMVADVTTKRAREKRKKADWAKVRRDRKAKEKPAEKLDRKMTELEEIEELLRTPKGKEYALRLNRLVEDWAGELTGKEKTAKKPIEPPTGWAPSLYPPPSPEELEANRKQVQEAMQRQQERWEHDRDLGLLATLAAGNMGWEPEDAAARAMRALTALKKALAMAKTETGTPAETPAETPPATPSETSVPFLDATDAT